jgi:homocitrate synthase NifV
VSIALPISDIQLEARGWNRKWVMDKFYESIEYAKEHGLYVSYVMEDAPRASNPFLMKCALDAKDLGADRVVYCDSVGVANPADTYEKIKTIVNATEMDVGVQMRNDFGMATANTFAAMKAGAKFVDASIMGIGSRAGNAPLEEIALAAEEMLRVDTGIDLPTLKIVADNLAKASGRRIWESKPVFGSGCFAQEGGVGSDGEMASNEVLEPYDPTIVGGVREIVIGKHSTGDSIRYVLKKRGLDIHPSKLGPFTALVKQSASDLHRSLTPEELEDLYYDMENGDFLDDEDADDGKKDDEIIDE